MPLNPDFDDLLEEDQDASYFINRLFNPPPLLDQELEAKEEAMTTTYTTLREESEFGVAIQPSSRVLVEVHGLPDNQVKSFTYLNPSVVHVGELVTVPAPEWSIRVTGREYLPGFVLGLSEEKGGYALRAIVQEPASPARAGLRDVVTQWREMADASRERADEFAAQAKLHETQAEQLEDQAQQVENALDGELGF